MSRTYVIGSYCFAGDQLTNLYALNTYFNNTLNNWSVYYDETGSAYTPSGSNQFYVKVFETSNVNSVGAQMDFGYAQTSPGLNATSAPSTMQYFGAGSAGILLHAKDTAGSTALVNVNYIMPNGNYLIGHDDGLSQFGTMAYGYEGS